MWGHVPGTRVNKEMGSLLLRRWHSRTGRANAAVESPAWLSILASHEARKTKADLQVSSCVSSRRPTGAGWVAGARWPTCEGASFTMVRLAHGPKVAGQSWQGPVGLP